MRYYNIWTIFALCNHMSHLLHNYFLTAPKHQRVGANYHIIYGLWTMARDNDIDSESETCSFFNSI